jgi:uncharacterized membrane protein YphA (DoxX/SURF4 family)
MKSESLKPTFAKRGESNSAVKRGVDFFSRPSFFLFWRLLLGAVFVAAGVSKIVHPAEFAKIIHNYQILPDGLINVVAIVLPWLEMLLGALLAAGIWLPGAAALANLLLLSFFSALLFNLARGIDVHCGCFSTQSSGSPHTVWYILRDSSFLLLGIVVLLQVLRRRAGYASRP